MQVEWLKTAAKNLEDAYVFLAKENPVVAGEFIKEVYRLTQLLLDSPALGRPGRVPGTKELVLPNYPYLIPYRIRGNQVQILRVFHTRQAPPKQW
jgi:Plasmid stabilization system protein